MVALRTKFPTERFNPSRWHDERSGPLTIEVPYEVTFGPDTLIRVEACVDGNLLSSGELGLP